MGGFKLSTPNNPFGVMKKPDVPIVINEHQVRKELIQQLQEAQIDTSHQLDPKSRGLRAKARLLQKLIQRDLKNTSSVSNMFSQH